MERLLSLGYLGYLDILVPAAHRDIAVYLACQDFQLSQERAEPLDIVERQATLLSLGKAVTVVIAVIVGLAEQVVSLVYQVFLDIVV